MQRGVESTVGGSGGIAAGGWRVDEPYESIGGSGACRLVLRHTNIRRLTDCVWRTNAVLWVRAIQSRVTRWQNEVPHLRVGLCHGIM
jgi:hypothetical protein